MLSFIPTASVITHLTGRWNKAKIVSISEDYRSSSLITGCSLDNRHLWDGLTNQCSRMHPKWSPLTEGKKVLIRSGPHDDMQTGTTKNCSESTDNIKFLPRIKNKPNPDPRHDLREFYTLSLWYCLLSCTAVFLLSKHSEGCFSSIYVPWGNYFKC